MIGKLSLFNSSSSELQQHMIILMPNGKQFKFKFCFIALRQDADDQTQCRWNQFYQYRMCTFSSMNPIWI